MSLIKDGLLPFILTKLENAQNDASELTDLLLTFYSEIILELFEKMRDIYCVLESVNIVSDQIIEKGLKIQVVKTTLFT